MSQNVIKFTKMWSTIREGAQKSGYKAWAFCFRFSNAPLVKYTGKFSLVKYKGILPLVKDKGKFYTVKYKGKFPTVKYKGKFPLVIYKGKFPLVKSKAEFPLVNYKAKHSRDRPSPRAFGPRTRGSSGVLR